MWIEFTENDEVYKNKIFSDKYFDSEKIEFSKLNIDNYLISVITNFHQKLKELGNMTDQVGLLVQYYKINLPYQNWLFVKEELLYSVT